MPKKPKREAQIPALSRKDFKAAQTDTWGKFGHKPTKLSKKEQKHYEEACAQITEEIEAEIAENPNQRPYGWPDPRLH